MKKTVWVAHWTIALMIFAVWTPNIYAFEGFDDGGGAGLSACAPCHTHLANFGPGHGAHAALSNNNCGSCHDGGAGFNDPPLANCVRCHGRDADAGGDGISAGLGRGLRQHHQGAGVLCGNCHSDATGPVGVGENVLPSFYPSTGLDPCNGSEEQFPSVTVSLDNDGDGLTDGTDPDCAAPTTTTTVSSTTTTSTTTSTTLPSGGLVSAGKKIVVKGNLPSAKRIIVALAKEKPTDIGMSGMKGIAGGDDPAANGAVLTIAVNASAGGTSSSQIFNVPSGNFNTATKKGWKTLPVGYKYLDPKQGNGPVKVLLIRRTPGDVFLMKAVVKGFNPTGGFLDVDVVPPNGGDPVDATMSLQINSGNRYCAGWVNPKKNIEKVFMSVSDADLAGCP